MAPLTFHLVALNDSASEKSLLSAVRSLPKQDRPIYVGKCQHWIHAPTLSTGTLYNDGSNIKRWHYLLVTLPRESGSLDLPGQVGSYLGEKWSITTEGIEAMLDSYQQTHQTQLNTPAPSLPDGWSPTDHSGLDAAVPPEDLEASLALKAHPLGSSVQENADSTALKDWTSTFGSEHTGAICMFNLLSYLPGGRARYQDYIAAFSASVGSKYGGEAMFLGLGATDWSSKGSAAEADEANLWEDAALIHYPSIWHFAKMLDDPGYADADRKFKQGALRDNPILCCIEIEVRYEE